MNVLRFKQLFNYGWLHASQISEDYFGGRRRLAIFIDILRCFQKYEMWSSQYLKEHFWELRNEDRERIGQNYQITNRNREVWLKDFYTNRRFIAKWSKYEIEQSANQRQLRKDAYTKRYGAGTGLMVEYGVELSRQHYLPGTIKIGNNVLLAKNVFIDYSGVVIIEDRVKIANGVCIESHHRDLEAYRQGKDVNIPTKLRICEGAFIGTRAIILDSCNYIGKYSRIGAGAVVTKDVPDYSVVVGVPAKVVKLLNNTNE